MKQSELASALREYRIKNNVKQDTIASLLGVNQAQISRWENQQVLPRGGHAKRIRDLVFGKNPPFETSLRYFVASSSGYAILFDQNHQALFASPAVQEPDGDFARRAWLFDPAKNESFRILFKRYRELLDDPTGTVALDILLPFKEGGQPMIAVVKKVIFQLDQGNRCLANISFRPELAGDPESGILTVTSLD